MQQTNKMQQLPYYGVYPVGTTHMLIIALPVYEAVAVQRVLPAQPIVEVNLDFHIWTLLSDDGDFIP